MMHWCILCGFVGDIDSVRKHQFGKHYDYYKYQHYDDSQLIEKVMEEKN